jgi:MraZ protein
VYGEYRHTIDAKGRVAVPSDLRGELTDKFHISYGHGGCLIMYPPEAWARIQESVKAMEPKESREFTRRFFSGVQPCDTDKQGRILINANLRQYANLQKNVIIIGANDKGEIWDLDAWLAYKAKSDERLSMDDVIDMLGI